MSELREARISEEHTHHRGAAFKRDSWMEIDVDRQVEWTSEADASVAVDMLRPLVGGADAVDISTAMRGINNGGRMVSSNR